MPAVAQQTGIHRDPLATLGLYVPVKQLRLLQEAGLICHGNHPLACSPSPRYLMPGEYTQMAGRAGRRGLDAVGHVLVACWEDIPGGCVGGRGHTSESWQGGEQICKDDLP
jgi:hypothetical protein